MLLDLLPRRGRLSARTCGSFHGVSKSTSAATMWAHVDGHRRLKQAVRRGDLVVFHLLPADFGGDSRPENTVYVPPWVSDVFAQSVMPLIKPGVEEGLTRFEGRPEYVAPSRVPVRIRYLLSGSDGAKINFDLGIWGPYAHDHTGV